MQIIKVFFGIVLLIFAFFAPFYVGPSYAIFIDTSYAITKIPVALIDYGLVDITSGLLACAIIVIFLSGLWMIIEVWKVI